MADDSGIPALAVELTQHLPHRLTRYTKSTGRLPLAYTLNMTGKPNS